MRASLFGKNKYLDKILSDGQFRMFLTASFSGGWNFIYAIFNLVLAGIYRSYWFVTLGAYYIALGCMRAAVVALGKSQRDHRQPETVVAHIGAAFFLLDVIFAGTVVLSITENHTQSFGTIVMITMAAYTFYLLTMAVRNFYKARKRGRIREKALRNISLGGVIVSLFSLEKSMLASFTTDADTFIFRMEAYSGAGIFLILVLLGSNLILESKRSLGRIKKER